MSDINNKLTEIQNSLNAKKSKFNKFGNFYYRTAEDILEALKPLVKENGCGYLATFGLQIIGEYVYISATATISCGEQSVCSTAYAREEPERKGFAKEQLTGSAQTYALKYALQALLAIDDTQDVDSLDKSSKETQCKCKQCGKDMKPDIYYQHISANGFAACSQECLKKIKEKLKG